MSDENQLESEEIVQEEVSENGEEQAASEDQLEDEIKEAIENGASQKQIQQMVKEFKLKVNGKEFVRKIDLSNEDELQKELQMALAGRKAMEEAAELKKLYMQDIETLKSDPMGVLAQLGLDPETLAYNYLQQKVEESKKSPEEVEREQMQSKLKELEQQLEKERAEKEEKEWMRQQQEANVNLENEMLEALENDPELPKSPRVIQEIARSMMWAYKNGFTDVKAADVIPTVKYKLERDFNNLFEMMPEQMFEKYIGRKNLERYRSKKLEQIQKQPKPAPSASKVAQSGKSKPQESVQKQKVSLEDFLRNL